MKFNNFDFEQKIMECWGVVEDFKVLGQGVMDIGMTEDQIANALIGLEQMYDLKFQQLFSMFEQSLKKPVPNFRNVNRFEVINHVLDFDKEGFGRALVFKQGESFTVKTSLQDDGKTLKIFLSNNEEVI